MKIINILHHPPLPIHFGNRQLLEDKIKFEYEEIDDKGNWVGFFIADHHATTSYETLKRTNEFEIECWRPYNNRISKVYSKEINGIVHRVFPCKTKKYPFWGEQIWSDELYQELVLECKKGRVLIHFHDGHSKFVVRLLLKLKPSNIPIVYQHRSNKFSIFRYRNSPWYKKYNVSNLIDFNRQKLVLKYIDIYFSDSIYERRFLRNILKFMKFIPYKQGIDFGTFHPASEMEKQSIRHDIGLNEDSFVLLYVGRFYSEKNVDILINVFDSLKTEIPNIELLLVGGYDTDEFYELAVEKGARVFERVPEFELIKYYQIANVYIMPVNNYTVKYFGGFGNAPIQALATNIPIITSNIIHFLGTQEEKNKIGMMMSNRKDLEKAILYIRNNRETFLNCREIARQYYDIDSTMSFLISTYRNLFDQYYSNVI